MPRFPLAGGIATRGGRLVLVPELRLSWRSQQNYWKSRAAIKLMSESMPLINGISDPAGEAG